jgi:1-acyl-sn-glycerol-3-phosphate acyltransferase
MWNNKFYQKYAMKQIALYKKKKEHYIQTDSRLGGVDFKRRIHPILRKILHVRNKLTGLTFEVIGNTRGINSDEPVIYALTHIGKFDFEIFMDAYNAFCYPIAGDWELMYGEIDDYFLRLNGVMYVDTNDKDDRANTSKAIVKMLKQGIPILIYPEGVWNLTESMPMMKIFPGAIRAAQASNVPIVPVAIEQYGTHFRINMGEKMWIQGNKQEELTRLRDQMATLQWMNWEYQGAYKRCDIADDYYKNFVANKLAEWSKYNMDIINGRIYRDKLDREFLSLEKDLEGVRSG